jgi:hypothetical protein
MLSSLILQEGIFQEVSLWIHIVLQVYSPQPFLQGYDYNDGEGESTY